MSKSILVVETPENCHKCLFSEFHDFICGITNCNMSKEQSDKKPDWCPLGDIPNKTSVGIEICIGNNTECVKSYVDGYNACIDEILKGANGNE